MQSTIREFRRLADPGRPGGIRSSAPREPGRWPTVVPLLLCSAFGVSAAAATRWGPEQRRAYAEQAALADGYRQLREQVLAVPVKNGHTLNDVAATSDSMAMGLRRLTAQADRLGKLRRYRNGDVEIDLRLPLQPLIERLAKLYAAAEPTGPVKVADLEATASQSGQQALLVTGYGQEPTPEELTGPPGWPGGKDAGDLPPAGWADVAPAGFKAAERAAQLDAADHLARKIAELKMDRSGTVGNLIATAPAIGDGLRQPFAGLGFSKPEYVPEQVCRTYAEVNVNDVVTRLERLLASLQTKIDVPEGDVRSITRLASVRRLRAVGYGLPPASMLRKNRWAVLDVDQPAWARESIRAKGETSMSKQQPVTDRLVELAVQDARIAAQLDIAKKIDALELPGGVTVATFLDRHEMLAEDILTFLSAARLAVPPAVDKDKRQVAVTMELPLRRLWLILRDAIPTTPTTTMPAQSQ
ncbi:MAG: hypothetical protein JXQ73_33035 [Phycisphaerae bacterium]|nr:hypothetical protein [Phycisphaerae bacterium]